MASPGAAPKEDKGNFMDVKEVFRKGKAQTLNYALAVSKKRGDPPAFIVHKKKEGAQLLKAAKEKSGNKIGIIGTLTCTTKTFDLTVKEGKPTTMMAKQLRLYLKANQLKQKVSIKAPDGKVIGDGEDDEETTEETAADGAAQEEAQTGGQEQAAAEPESSADSESSSQEQQEEDSAPSGDAFESAKQELKAAVTELDLCRKKAAELVDLRAKLEAHSDPDAQTAALNARGACREAKETADEAGEYLKEAPVMLKEAEKGKDEKLLAEALGEVHSAQEKLESSEFSADKADKMLAEYAKLASAPAQKTEKEDQAKEQEQPAAKSQEEAPAAAEKAGESAKKGRDSGPVKALLEQIKAQQKKTKKAVATGEELVKLREQVAAQGDPDSEVAARNANGMVRDAVEAAQEADQYIKDAMEQAKQAAKAGGQEGQEYIKEAESILGGIDQKLEEVDYSSERARGVLSSAVKDSQQDGEQEQKGQTQAEKGGESKDQEAQIAPRQAAEVPEELAKAVDNRKAFKQARQLWVKTRDKAIEDLETVKQGARNAYMDDLEQFPVVQRKLGDLDEILDNLNDDLRVTLDAYVSTPLRNQQKMEELAEEAKQLLNGYMSYVKKSPLLDGIDQKEFANVTMKAPLLKALQQLERAIV